MAKVRVEILTPALHDTDQIADYHLLVQPITRETGIIL